MTPQEKAKYQAEVMISFAEGKEIEVVNKGYSDWSATLEPLWQWLHFDYRVKPEEPKKAKLEAWITDTNRLAHFVEGEIVIGHSSWRWTRVPSLDLEYEVTE